MSLEIEIKDFDERRNFIIPGDSRSTVEFSAKQFIEIGKKSIAKHALFNVALSGGSTPHAIFNLLCTSPYINELDWNQVHFFWSDERCVPPDHPESNYGTAMQAGLNKLPIPPKNIFRMKGELDPKESAREYEKVIRQFVPSNRFDLVMLGMGEDGHTASLFPHTAALEIRGQLAAANYVPEKKIWRLTLSYTCINNAEQINIYVMGKNKGETIAKVLLGSYEPKSLPIQAIGTAKNKALWILDSEAAQKLIMQMKV